MMSSNRDLAGRGSPGNPHLLKSGAARKDARQSACGGSGDRVSGRPQPAVCRGVGKMDPSPRHTAGLPSCQNLFPAFCAHSRRNPPRRTGGFQQLAAARVSATTSRGRQIGRLANLLPQVGSKIKPTARGRSERQQEYQQPMFFLKLLRKHRAEDCTQPTHQD